VPLKPVQLPQQRSRANELYDWLRDAIVSGKLQPHERLVETTVAQLASVSRTPVREALHRLEVDGFVREGDGGMEVCGFSLDELSDLCAVRETLEGMAARLAAGSHSEMEIATLRQLVSEEERLLDEKGDQVVLARVELNHSFHDVLWRTSRNRYLADTLHHLRSLIERMQDTTLRYRDRIHEAVEEHKQIVDALERRDGDAAEERARRHLRHAMARRLGVAAGTNGRR
jgi:DNA-binding GntR family transcriptional regulator